MLSLLEEKNRDFWNGINEENGYGDILNVLRDLYDKHITDGIGKQLYSERRMFYSSGNRNVFEKTYFHRRHLLDTAALLALIEPEKEEYLITVQDCIMAICEEYSWALPAHTDGTLEKDRTVVDLFAAETALELSEILMFLDDRIDNIVKVVAKEHIFKRVFDNYENNIFWWEEKTNNWSAVCAGSIGCAMMYLDTKRFDDLLPRFLHSMDCFLSGFPNDGTCLEGIAYWHYGFGAFAFFADMLYRYTDGKTDLFEDEKVKKCAEYMQRNFLVGDTTVSFADGVIWGKSGYGIQYFLHKRYPDTVKLLPKKFLYATGNSYWLNISRALFYYDPKLNVLDVEHNEYYMPDAAQYIVSKDKFSFAIKAGHNNEPHNHNDIGSFIISTKHGQELCDLGAGQYTRQYFSAYRYDILCNNSLGHSVPIVNGCEQKFGKEYFGTMTVNGNTVTVEFAGAYGIDGLTRLIREATVLDNCIVIKDSWNMKCDGFTERFVTTIEPRVEEGGVKLKDITIKYPLSLTPLISVKEHIEHDGEITKVYCIDFCIASDMQEIQFTFIAD